MDNFQHAQSNANKDCPKCKGKGAYMYDHNHGKICELCCRHNRGWFQLTKGHGDKAGLWCCKAGCGHVVETKPEDIPITKEDAAFLIDLKDNPPEPNDFLKAAVEKFNKLKRQR